MDGSIVEQTILLVDDNEIERKYLALQLEAAGYTVLESEDGRNLESLLDRTKIDLVLLDIVLPDKDGLAILKKLRVKHSAVALPIIMLTSRGDSTDIVEALSFGANDYVTKPADLSVLVARMKTHLTLKQAKESLRESEERYSLAVMGANDGIWDWNLKNDAIYFSAKWKTILGYDVHEIRDAIEEWFRLVHPEDLSRVKEAIKLHVEALSDHLEVEYRMADKTGQYRWILTRGLAIRDTAGRAYRMAGSQTDVSENKLTDALSGLPNRTLFMDRLAHAYKLLRRRNEAVFAVFVINIDRFNVVNESIGQFAGDNFLREFSRRLLECLRPEDTVARFSGDEFVVLIEGVRDSQDAANFVERIRKKISQPFRFGEREFFISVGVGMVFGTAEYEKSEDIVRDAQTALRRAKLKGVSNFETFNSSMHARVVSRFQMEAELRRAMDREELFLCYHPIVSAADSKIRGFEALVRWKHSQRGLIPPDEFIPIAEEAGVITMLGEYILQRACLGMRNLTQRGFGEYFVAVNFSGRQFQQKNIVEAIEKTLKISGFEPAYLKVELTESILMDNVHDTIAKLSRLRDLGVQISIDDFGTGYSSLSYLKKFPISTLKIDKSFVKDIEFDPGAASIVRAIVAMAHNLNLDVVAEGVETDPQFDFLKECGCDNMQGFLFSVPLPMEELELFLASNLKTDGIAL